MDQHECVTEYSRGPAEPDVAPAEAAAENTGLSQDERTELERLRAETAELRRQTAGPGRRRRRRVSWRTPVAIVLIVLGCVLAPVAVLGVWAGNEVSNTGRWVATVEPLIHDPAIQNVLSEKITTSITNQLNLSGLVNQASTQLNSKGLTRISSLLTTFGPQITGAITGFISSTVHSVIASPAMAKAWTQINTVAHQGLVKVLSGQGNGTFSVSDGKVVLNLGPLITVAKQDLVQRGFSLAKAIPNINPTVALFEANDLGKAQTGYRLVNDFKIVSPILVLVLLGAGVYVARGRRRALVGAGLGLAASMLVLGIGLDIGRGIYLGRVPASVLPADAAGAAYDALIHFLRESLRVVLLVGLVVAIGAYFTGPGAAAVRTRSALRSGLAWIRGFGERRGVSAGPVGEWTWAHRRGLRIGVVALAALVFVFLGEPTVVTVIVLVVILLVLLGLIELIGRPAAEPQTSSPA
jgi:hypothetical protein